MTVVRLTARDLLPSAEVQTKYTEVLSTVLVSYHKVLYHTL